MKNVFLFLIAGTLLTACAKNNKVDPGPDDNKTPAETVIPTLSATTFVGNEAAGSTDGTGTAVKFNQIIKLTADQAGNVYVLDDTKPGSYLYKIKKITPAGVATTIFDGGSRTKLHQVLDIAATANGTIYALANVTQFLPVVGGMQKNYREYGIYKLQADTLARVSITTAITNQPDAMWIDAHNLVNKIAVDATGNVYGAYNPPGAAATKVYQITPTPALMNGNTEAVLPATLTADAAGALYASTATGILKITASGVSSVFTFPTVKSAFKPKVVGSQSANLFVYGDIYNKANEFKGTGFYKVKTDGTIVSKAIMGNPANIVSVAAGASGKFYYAIQLNQGGYMIYKTQFD